jgi:hypothetical protein
MSVLWVHRQSAPAEVENAPSPSEDDADAANACFRNYRAAEREGCWLLAQAYADEVKKLLNF